MTTHGTQGVNIGPVSPEEELADFFTASQPHTACLVQKNGIIRMQPMPDRAAAQAVLMDWLLDCPSFDRCYVKPAPSNRSLDFSALPPIEPSRAK